MEENEVSSILKNQKKPEKLAFIQRVESWNNL